MNHSRFTLFLAISIFISFLIINDAAPQIVSTTSGRNKPAVLTVEFVPTYCQPLPNMFGDVGEFFSFKNYGVTIGFGAQVNFKVTANKKGTIRPYATIGYALFRGSDNSVAYIDSNIIRNGYPLPGDTRFNSTPGTSKIFLHDFYGGFGFEYAFVNRTRVTPFLLTDFDLNLIFGTYRQDPVKAAGGGTSDEVSFTIKQGARFGFAFGGGFEARLGKIAGLVVSTKYRFANLLGKSSERISELNKMQLLDKSAPDLNSSLNKDRNINYLEFGVGVVFYVGKK